MVLILGDKGSENKITRILVIFEVLFIHTKKKQITERMIKLDELAEKAKRKEYTFKATLKKINKKNARKIDPIVHAIHDEAFEKTNCLECGNCCKTISPHISEADIKRMAKATRMKAVTFIDQYIQVDEDDDYVFNTMPCPFLAEDNYCLIYENRPKACREYPHTDRKNFFQLKELTLLNSKSCPAVFEILAELSKKI